MKKILYVCGRLPNNENAGGILYDNILRTYGYNNFSILSVSNKINLTEFNKHYQKITNRQFSLCFPDTNIFYKILKKLPLIEPVYILLYKNIVINRIIKYAQNQNCEMIFAPLRGEVLLVLGDIIKATNLPLIAMIEDTVEREIDDHRIIYAKKKKQYYNLLTKTNRLAVAGETMQEYFKSNFNIESIIIRPSYLKSSNIPLKQINNTINIFFSGNIYAKNEMKMFLNAISMSNNPGLKIVMYIAAHKSINFESNRVKVINLGWITENKLMEYMGKCHISYLPYKSEPKFMHSMKYAFPGKAGFYIANNLPIFFHGPSYSSFNTFLKTYKVGVSCSSMNPTIILKSLNTFIKNQKFYTSCQKECSRAFELEFNNDIFKKRIFDFFNLNN